MPFFVHDTVNFFYTTHGPPPSASVPTFLLLHGWACDANDFARQIPYLVSLSAHVVTLDLRGHGHSSCAPPSEYSLRTMASDVLALLSHLGIPSVILVAHSMSTITSSILAVEHPEVVKALVLLHPIYSGTPPALAAMAQEMRADPSIAPDRVAAFFANHMYADATPVWLRVWHERRVLACDPAMLCGCAAGVVALFDSVVGQSAEARAFMLRRECPRWVLCTKSVPWAAAWERELGVRDGVDCVGETAEGTFAHFVEAEEVNKGLGEWLVARGLIDAREE